LAESESICGEDKETIRRFVLHLKAQDVSTGRLAKYTYHLKNAIERLGTGTQRAKREDIERLVAWLQHDPGYTPHTVSDYLFATNRFFKFARFGNVDRVTPYPEEVRWIRTAMKANERKEPLFFTSAEVEVMIKTATSLRDKAMLAVGQGSSFSIADLTKDVVLDFSRLDEAAKTFYAEIALRQIWNSLTVGASTSNLRHEANRKH